MNQLDIVREITPRQCPEILAARTGDHLADGTVVLWRKDMDRMGLRALREFLLKAVEDDAHIAVGTETPVVHAAPDEEFAA